MQWAIQHIIWYLIPASKVSVDLWLMVRQIIVVLLTQGLTESSNPKSLYFEDFFLILHKLQPLISALWG